MKNKNYKLLKEFTKYCEKHPEQRFWQALRNWAGVGFIKINNSLDDELGDIDTFYFEERNR